MNSHRYLIAVIFALTPTLACADAVKVVCSKQSGPWSAADTWENGQKPAAGVQVLVRPGHRVLYDVHSKDVIRLVQIAGTLEFARDRDTCLEVGLIKIVDSEKLSEDGFDCHAPLAAHAGSSQAALLVGTPNGPVPAKHTALIRLHYVAGMDEKSCPAIVCCGGRMDFHGALLKRTWVRLEATVAAGTDVVMPQEPVEDWKAGDLVVLTSTRRRFFGRFGGDNKNGLTEQRRVKSIDLANRNITLDKAVESEHFAEGKYRGEIANLSRNVVVESADPAGKRGHTMYHRHSSGAISYAEFRHLGKKDVLGRYSLHFHQVGDTMRGSYVVGASIWDSHNRWLTIHGTSYLVVRDNVGYKSVGHGFFLEDGTETYNILDHNLAIEAQNGKPLPEQLLPFDDNRGAGFWWANCLNSFTHNVAVDCAAYGFRFDNKKTKDFDPVLPILQPDGTTKKQDTRTLPFIVFDSNEAHTQKNGGLNLRGMNQLSANFSFPKLNAELVKDAQDAHPDFRFPFHIRNFKCWESEWAFHAGTSGVFIDGLDVWRSRYGVWRSVIDRHTYVNTSYKDMGHRDMHMPFSLPIPEDDAGYEKDYFRGIARFVDKQPPVTVITHVIPQKGKLLVRGSVADASKIKHVLVNGQNAVATRPNFAEWEIVLDQPSAITEIAASALDAEGNRELTPHRWKVK